MQVYFNDVWNFFPHHCRKIVLETVKRSRVMLEMKYAHDVPAYFKGHKKIGKVPGSVLANRIYNDAKHDPQLAKSVLMLWYDTKLLLAEKIKRALRENNYSFPDDPFMSDTITCNVLNSEHLTEVDDLICFNLIRFDDLKTRLDASVMSCLYSYFPQLPLLEDDPAEVSDTHSHNPAEAGTGTNEAAVPPDTVQVNINTVLEDQYSTLISLSKEYLICKDNALSRLDDIKDILKRDVFIAPDQIETFNVLVNTARAFNESIKKFKELLILHMADTAQLSRFNSADSIYGRSSILTSWYEEQQLKRREMVMDKAASLQRLIKDLDESTAAEYNLRVDEILSRFDAGKQHQRALDELDILSSQVTDELNSFTVSKAAAVLEKSPCKAAESYLYNKFASVELNTTVIFFVFMIDADRNLSPELKYKLIGNLAQYLAGLNHDEMYPVLGDEEMYLKFAGIPEDAPFAALCALILYIMGGKKKAAEILFDFCSNIDLNDKLLNDIIQKLIMEQEVQFYNLKDLELSEDERRGFLMFLRMTESMIKFDGKNKRSYFDQEFMINTNYASRSQDKPDMELLEKLINWSADNNDSAISEYFKFNTLYKKKEADSVSEFKLNASFREDTLKAILNRHALTGDQCISCGKLKYALNVYGESNPFLLPLIYKISELFNSPGTALLNENYPGLHIYNHIFNSRFFALHSPGLLVRLSAKPVAAKDMLNIFLNEYSESPDANHSAARLLEAGLTKPLSMFINDLSGEQLTEIQNTESRMLGELEADEKRLSDAGIPLPAEYAHMKNLGLWKYCAALLAPELKKLQPEEPASDPHTEYNLSKKLSDMQMLITMLSAVENKETFTFDWISEQINTYAAVYEKNLNVSSARLQSELELLKIAGMVTYNSRSGLYRFTRPQYLIMFKQLETSHNRLLEDLFTRLESASPDAAQIA